MMRILITDGIDYLLVTSQNLIRFRYNIHYKRTYVYVTNTSERVEFEDPNKRILNKLIEFTKLLEICDSLILSNSN